MSMPALLHAERRQHRWQMAAAWRRCNPAWLTSCLVTVVSHSNQQCVTCVIHFILQYSPYAVMEWIQIQGICRPVVMWWISVSLSSYGSMSMISWHALLLENVAFTWNMLYLLAAYGKNSILVATISFLQQVPKMDCGVVCYINWNSVTPLKIMRTGSECGKSSLA